MAAAVVVACFTLSLLQGDVGKLEQYIENLKMKCSNKIFILYLSLCYGYYRAPEIHLLYMYIYKR